MRFLKGYSTSLKIINLLVNLGTAQIVPQRRFRLPTPQSDTVTASVSLFDWSDVTPSSDLVYRDCYDGFHCARLLVPLDWQNASSSNISIAIVRLPSTAELDSPAHGGSLILNPGGPGASGVEFALSQARIIQDHLKGEKEYEILSFDPRGVKFSEPKLECFSSVADRNVWNLGQRMAGAIDESNAKTLSYHWSGAEALAELCAGRDPTMQNVRQYVSTTYVARDLLHIVEKIDQEKKSRQVVVNGSPSRQVPLEQTQERVSKLQYLGLSYGTYLGQVFASMFPDRVERMILDSVVDGDDWTNTPTYSILNDTDKVLGYFYDVCYKNGNGCPLWQPEDINPSNISERVNDLLEELDTQPAVSTGSGTAFVVTGDDIRLLLFQSLYNPLVKFQVVAEVIHDLINKQSIHLPQVPMCPSCLGVLDFGLFFETLAAISCTDGPDLRNKPLSDFEQYFTTIKNQSAFFAPIWGEAKILCWKWPWRTQWPFTQQFNTSVPILFSNNRLDPVTPLGNAQKVALRYTGSVLLEHESVGHGALFPGSRCMWDHARRYLHDGTLPIEGTTCSADCEPFGGPCPSELDVMHSISENNLPK